MINDKLAQHISNELWVQKSKVVEVLGKFKGEKVEPPLVKHPIELVNEKYPNGWYCKAFEELKKDMAEITGNSIFTDNWLFYGWRETNDNMGYIASKYDFSNYNSTLITKSEYLAITIGVVEPPQRDYTGVKFKHSDDNEVRIIEKATYSEKYPYSISNGSLQYKQEEVERLFANGAWIEIPQEEEEEQQQYIKNEDVERQIDAVFNGVAKHKREHIQDAIDSLTFKPTIHASKPNDVTLEERVKALESKCEDIVKETSFHIEAINKIVTDLNSKVYGYDGDSSLPTKRNLDSLPTKRNLDSLPTKRNLPIETDDWKKVECLSWEDMKEILSSGLSIENYIKNKLKSKATLQP